MDRPNLKIFVFGLLLLSVLAPFAGLAPLLLILFLAVFVWIIRGLWQALTAPTASENIEESET
ncbi:MAG: hypothetical protein F6K04_23730 [Leptolyngbya sp. SIO4C5]|nr:hypothetical protein [Leptolyngbya sp. SIO4C5]